MAKASGQKAGGAAKAASPRKPRAAALAVVETPAEGAPAAASLDGGVEVIVGFSAIAYRVPGEDRTQSAALGERIVLSREEYERLSAIESNGKTAVILVGPAPEPIVEEPAPAGDPDGASASGEPEETAADGEGDTPAPDAGDGTTVPSGDAEAGSAGQPADDASGAAVSDGSIEPASL